MRQAVQTRSRTSAGFLALNPVPGEVCTPEQLKAVLAARLDAIDTAPPPVLWISDLPRWFERFDINHPPRKIHVVKTSGGKQSLKRKMLGDGLIDTTGADGERASKFRKLSDNAADAKTVAVERAPAPGRNLKNLLTMHLAPVRTLITPVSRKFKPVRLPSPTSLVTSEFTPLSECTSTSLVSSDFTDVSALTPPSPVAPEFTPASQFTPTSSVASE